MAERTSPAKLAGLLAVGLGVCCGLPLLASAGALGALAGISSCSWILIAAGVAIGAIGVWRGKARWCSTGDRQDPTSSASGTPERADSGGRRESRSA